MPTSNEPPVDASRELALAESGLSRADLYDAFLHDASEVTSIVDFMAHLLVSHDRPRVLDVGCGTGRLLPGMAARGWRVSGLEREREYAERARQRLARAGAKDTPITLGDMSGFVLPWQVDLAAAINGPFVYLLEHDDRRSALDCLYHALEPGGQLLLDIPNFLYILKHYRAPRPETARVEAWQVVRTPRHDFDYHSARWLHEDTIEIGPPEAPPRWRYTERYRFCILPLPELERLVREAGFEDLRTYNRWSDRAPTRIEGARIRLVARRPRS